MGYSQTLTAGNFAWCVLLPFLWSSCSSSTITDPHGHGLNGHAAHGPETSSQKTATGKNVDEKGSDLESAAEEEHAPRTWGKDTATQVVGVAILEFGVLLHRCAPLSSIIKSGT